MSLTYEWSRYNSISNYNWAQHSSISNYNWAQHSSISNYNWAQHSSISNYNWAKHYADPYYWYTNTSLADKQATNNEFYAYETISFNTATGNWTVSNYRRFASTDTTPGYGVNSSTGTGNRSYRYQFQSGNTGIYSTTQSDSYIQSYSKGAFISSTTGTYSQWTHEARNSDGYWWVRGTFSHYSKGSLIANTTGTYGYKTHEAHNSDGYWWVRGTFSHYSKGSLMANTTGVYGYKTHEAHNSDGYWWVRGTFSHYSKGSLMANTTGIYGYKTHEAHNSDGYWWVRGTLSHYTRGTYIDWYEYTYDAKLHDQNNTDGYWWVRGAELNKPPSVALTVNGVAQNDGHTILVTDKSMKIDISYAGDDINTNSSVERYMAFRGTIKENYTLSTKSTSYGTSFIYDDLVLGNNVVTIKFRDEKLAETTKSIVIRNKTPRTLSQSSTLDVLKALGYGNTVFTSLSVLMPSGYTGKLSMSDIINHLS